MSDDANTDLKDQRDADSQDESTHDTDDLGDAGKAALKRERDARKAAEKEKADLAKKIADFEKAQKDRDDEAAKAKGEWETVATAREKELEELKRSLAERDLNDLRRTVAADEGLPADLALRLQGDDEDALRTDAKALAKFLKAKDATDTDAGERTKPGTKKPDKGAFSDPAKWGLRAK